MVILARLAVDCTQQRSGLGRQLIADAVLRTLRIAEQTGVRGLLVSAIDKAATEPVSGTYCACTDRRGVRQRPNSNWCLTPSALRTPKPCNLLGVRHLRAARS
jgi:hypothetical protein